MSRMGAAGGIVEPYSSPPRALNGCGGSPARVAAGRMARRRAKHVVTEGEMTEPRGGRRPAPLANPASSSHFVVAQGPFRACVTPLVRPWWRTPHVAQGGYAMRTFDLAPLYRSTVGFDRLFSLLDQVSGFEGSGSTYPPYNIERTGENAYRITVAVAGFSDADI